MRVARNPGVSTDKEVEEHTVTHFPHLVVSSVREGQRKSGSAQDTSTRKQALMSRWEDAIWVGVAKKSNEHVVVREGGDQQLGVRLSSGGRSQADGVPKRLHCGNRARRHRREDLLRQRERSA